LSPHYRLFVITGLLGGLTTFSTFSSEVSMLLLRGDYVTGLALSASHLFGSLALTVVGFWAYRALAT
jgi:CrcB protein